MRWRLCKGWARLARLAVVASLIACGPRPLPIPSLEVHDLAATLRQTTGAETLPGNTLELIENGAVFDVMVRDIGAARESVHVVSYIWRGEDGPSTRMGEALLHRRAGVACRIVIDPFGSLKFSDALEERLRASGCDIRRYGPLRDLHPTARNHRKIQIVDGRVGVTGGWGIWRSWEGEGRAPDQWRDTAVRVEGPVVAQMQVAFDQSWREAGGAPLPSSAYPRLRERGPTRAAFVASSPREGPSAAERMTYAVIASARRQLWIANSYFIPDDDLIDVIARKRRAGVDVRVLAPGPVHDVPPVRAAQRATYERLLAAGVRIFEYQPSMMHAKTMVVDGRTVVIGSTNIDKLSFDRMEEGSLVADAPLVAHKLREHLEADFTHAKEITPELWSKRDLVPEIGRRASSLIDDWL